MVNLTSTIPTSDYELKNSLQEYENIDEKIMHIDELTSTGTLDDFVIVYLPNNGDAIGHWCLLHRPDDEVDLVEWFDPLAQPMPKALEVWLETRGYDWTVNPIQLQDLDTNSCGKFIVSRLMSLPCCLCEYLKVFTGNKLLSPNEIVEILIKLRRYSYGR